MTERFSGRSEDVTAPIRRGFAITPSDATDLGAETRAIYVGSAGDVELVLASGDAVSLAGVPGGALLPLRVTRVKASGTTAGLLVGLY